MFSSRTDWSLEENRLTKKVAELRAKGISILDLTESNPTKCGLGYLDNHILRALLHEDNLSYNPTPKGLLESRKIIAGYYKAKGIHLNPEQIILTTSTSEAYSHLFRLLTNPGDSILSPSPSYPLLEFLVNLCDIRLKYYTLCQNKGWFLDFDSIKPDGRTKALLVIHPNNPTGSYLKEDELKKLNQIATKVNCAIISDEVFLDYELDRPPNTVKSLSTNQEALTFTVSGISKILGLPQMKLGWIVVSGPKGLMDSAIKRLEVISDTFLSLSTPIQNALASWFELKPTLQNKILGRVRENYQILQSLIKESNCTLPVIEGGWYGILKVAKTFDEEEFLLALLEKEHILIHPGYFFDFEEGVHLIVSLLPETDNFRTGIRKTLDFLNRF